MKLYYAPGACSLAPHITARELGIDVKYTEVPGGTHGNILAPNFAAMFDFLDAHRKTGGATQ